MEQITKELIPLKIIHRIELSDTYSLVQLTIQSNNETEQLS